MVSFHTELSQNCVLSKSDTIRYLPCYSNFWCLYTKRGISSSVFQLYRSTITFSHGQIPKRDRCIICLIWTKRLWLASSWHLDGISSWYLFCAKTFERSSDLKTDLKTPITIMDMRNNKRRNVLTHARVNFSQSGTISLLRGGGGGLNFELLLWGGGLTEKIHFVFFFMRRVRPLKWRKWFLVWLTMLWRWLLYIVGAY